MPRFVFIGDSSTSRESSFFQDLLNRIDSTYFLLRQDTLNAGGQSGPDGGTGGRPGGVSGQFLQTQIAGDSTESSLHVSTSGSIGSLLDNLKNLRGYSYAAKNFWASSGSPPTTALTISSGSWHHTSGQEPLYYNGGLSPAVSAPSSGSRLALLTINTAGVLSWTYGVEAANPAPPSFPAPTSGSMPLWMILTRSSGSVITQYDRGLSSHYILRDERPFLDWGTGGGGGTSGSLPGDWMTNTGDVMNFAPTNVLTVGANGRYPTIQSAVNAATAGQAIWIGPGTYNESVTLKNGVDLVGVDKRLVIIEPTIGADVHAVIVPSGARCYVSNLTASLTPYAGGGNQPSGIRNEGGYLIGENIHVIVGQKGAGFLAVSSGSSILSNCSAEGRSNASASYGYTTTVFNFSGSSGGYFELDNCRAVGLLFGIDIDSSGFAHVSSGSYISMSGGGDIAQGTPGLLSISGGRWRNTSGSINFVDWPNNVVTVGPFTDSNHCMYNTITTALFNTTGFASTSNPVTIVVAPGTYNESFTIGDYQEVIGWYGERTPIINGTVTMNGTRSALSRFRIAPLSGTGLVVSGGSPYIWDNAIISSSGSAVQVTSGTPTFKNNTFTGGTGLVLSGGTCLLDTNFHNSGTTLLINGATANLNDWMDVLTVTSGTVILGSNAAAESVTFSGGTVTGSIFSQLPTIGSLQGAWIKGKTSGNVRAGVFVDSNGTSDPAIFAMGFGGSMKWHFQRNSSGHFTISETGVADRFFITATDGNFGFRTSTFGASAQGVLGIANVATEPSTSPANMIQIYSKDSSDGTANATLAIRTEQAAEATATFTQTHRLKIWLNGTEYYLPLDSV